MQDTTTGRYLTSTFADYHIATHADVPEIEVHFIEKEVPHVNPLGVKSIGELGSAAAIANAIFHATGKRVRDLPITLDKLL